MRQMTIHLKHMESDFKTFVIPDIAGVAKRGIEFHD